MTQRTLGLIGGMSWQSTVSYYRQINEYIERRLGGLHSAQLALISVDFHAIEQQQASGDWQGAGETLADAARALQSAGAEAIVLCTNTMHRVADAIERATPLPLLHIVEPTAQRLIADGHRCVGLIGTRFTMQHGFYIDRLSRRHGLSVRTPDAGQQAQVHRVIYDELCRGLIRPESRETYRQVLASLVDQGASAIILGCTEIALLVNQDDCSVPLYDTTALHAQAAAEWSMAPTAR